MKRNTKFQRQRKIICKKLVYIVCYLCVSFSVFADTNYTIKHISGTHMGANIRSSSIDSPAILWNRTWGGTGMDSAQDLALDSSNNIYVVGKTNSTSFHTPVINQQSVLSQPTPPILPISDILLVKYNNSGQQEWYRTWGGVDDDEGRSLVIDSSDNIIIIGNTHSFGPGSKAIALIKYNSLGEKQWNVTYGSSGSDTGRGIALDSSGNIFIVGKLSSFGDNTTLVKFNSLGEYQWNKTWGGGIADAGWGIKLDSSDNIFITGFTFSYGTVGGDFFLAKFNDQGILLWNITWGGIAFEAGFSIELDSSNNIFVAGITSSFGAGGTDLSLLKFNSLGQLQWNKTWGGTDVDSAWGLVLDSSEDIYLGGGTENFGPGLSAGAFVKFDSSGQLQWNTTWGGSGEDYFTGIVIDSSDNIYITGYTDSFGSGMNDMVLIKYGESIPGNGAEWIPGYDLFLLICAICVISVIIIKKQNKSTIY